MLRTRVKTPGGTQSDITDSVSGLRYSNVNPGGFEQCTFDIPVGLAPQKGSTLQVSDDHGIVWEGRVEENDLAVSGAGDRRGVAAYGFGILLKRKSIAMDFVQSSLSGWTGPSLAMRASVAGTLQDESGEIVDGAIITRLAQPPWSATGLPMTEMWYRSPGPIGRVQGKWTRSGSGVGSGGTSHKWAVRLSTDDAAAAADGGTDLEAAGPSTFSVDSTTSTRYYVQLQYMYDAAFGTADSVERYIKWENLKVFGKHGLTIQGTGADAGLYPESVIRYLLGLVSGVDPGSIDAPTDWIMPQLALGQRASIEDYIFEINSQFGYDWGTWDSGNLFDPTPKFSWTAKQSSETWRIRRSDARSISLGSSLASMADTLYVKYTDASGQPQEYSSTASVRALADAGISGQEATIDAGLQVGDGPVRQATVFFALQGQDPPLSGTIELAGDMRLANGGTMPAYWARADGALIRVEDLLPITEVYSLSDTRQTLLPIKRVEVDASGEVPVTQLSIDQGNDALSVLQARMNQALTAKNLT